MGIPSMMSTSSVTIALVLFARSVAALRAAPDASLPRLHFLCGNQYALYSAFLDARAQRPLCDNEACTKSHRSADLFGSGQNSLRLLMMGSGTSWSGIANHNAFSCVVEYPGKPRLVIPGHHMPIREGHNKRVNGALLSCPLPQWLEWHASMRVALRLNDFAADPSECDDDAPLQTPMIRVGYVDDAQPSQPTVAVCLRPMYGEFSLERLAKLVEWLEISRAQDVSEVIVYDNVSTVVDGVSRESDHSLSRLLAPWIEEGFVTVLPWHEPYSCGHNCGIWSAGQTTAHNDCMYRLMNRHRWLLFVDVDEYVWSRASKSLPAISRALELEAQPTAAGGVVSSFVLPHYYMCYASDAKGVAAENAARKLGLPHTLSHDDLLPMLDVPNREHCGMKGGHTKNIVNPRLLIEMGVHVPHIHAAPLVRIAHHRANQTRVASAFLHHYRRGMAVARCAAKRVPPDYTMRPFLPAVVNRTLEKLRAILAAPATRALLVLETYYASTGNAGDTGQAELQTLRGKMATTTKAEPKPVRFRSTVIALLFGTALVIATLLYRSFTRLRNRFPRHSQRSRFQRQEVRGH